MSVPWKAVYGFVAGAAGSMLAFLQDKTSLDSMTATQWVIVVLTGVVASGGVYALPK